MKKSLLSVGAASFALAILATGCASVPQSPSFAEEVKKAEAVVATARGLENHNKLEDKYVIPNVLLAQSKVLYVDWAATATDAIGIRFGEADVISVARDATDTSNLKIWDAMRNASTDKVQADAAVADMKKFIAESYAKNKTTSKLSNDAMFETVVGKIAQEDYIAYKKALKEGASEADYKDQKAWLDRGKANAIKVAAEQKKMIEAAEKRLAAAEKEAEAAKHKLNLILKYHGNKLAIPGIKIGTAELHKALAGKVPDPVVTSCVAILNKELITVMENNMAEAKKEWDGVDTAISDSIPEFKMPQFDATGLTPFNAVSKVTAYKDTVNKEITAWQKKCFAPYDYALEIGGKRWDSFWEVKKWAKEAQKTLDEVSGE